VFLSYIRRIMRAGSAAQGYRRTAAQNHICNVRLGISKAERRGEVR
jgi:hypothetical protein